MVCTNRDRTPITKIFNSSNLIRIFNKEEVAEEKTKGGRFKCVSLIFEFIYIGNKWKEYEIKRQPKIHTLRVLKFMGIKKWQVYNCVFAFAFFFSLFFLSAFVRCVGRWLVFRTFNQFKFILNSQLTKQYNFRRYRSQMEYAVDVSFMVFIGHQRLWNQHYPNTKNKITLSIMTLISQKFSIELWIKALNWTIFEKNFFYEE